MHNYLYGNSYQAIKWLSNDFLRTRISNKVEKIKQDDMVPPTQIKNNLFKFEKREREIFSRFSHSRTLFLKESDIYTL
jgi:hypothetical protein